MAKQVDIEKHYDLNERDFFKKILGESMTYSCADWRQCTSLAQAQYQKYQKLARFAGIDANTRSVVDLGCGWGSNLKWLAENCESLNRITGITLSYEQASYIRDAILPTDSKKRITLLEMDIFDHLVEQNAPQYDAAISIGAFEHFASPKDYKKNQHIQKYAQFFAGTRRAVAGNLGLQTIVAARPANSLKGEARMRAMRFQYFIAKHIFPNALTPTLDYIDQATQGYYDLTQLELRGDEYAHTIMAWQENLQAHKNEVPHHQYQLFMRYFDLCIEHFLSGYISLARLSLRPV
ncbi:MAG TPA: class I SAM-dependent methyltransferase [Marinagarivorans sp.]